MKLKIAQVKTLLESLSQIDCYDQIAKVIGPDGKPQDKIVKKPYDLSGKTRWNIAKNVSILTKKMEGFGKVNDDLITQISEGANIIKVDEKEKIERYNKEIGSVLEIEDDVDGLLALTLHELKLDSELDINPFPTEVIKPLIDLGFVQ